MRSATVFGWVGLLAAAAMPGCGGASLPVGAAKAPAGCERSSDEPGPRHLDRTRAGSSVVVASFPDQARVAYVADEDQRAVIAIDLDERKVLHTTALDGTPTQLVLTADGRLVVALRDRSELVVFEPGDDPDDSLSERCTVPTPTEPVGLALSPKGDTLLVTSGWGRSLAIFAAKDMARRFVVALPREPRAVVASADGKSAFVTHMVGGWVSQVDLEHGTVGQRLSLDSPPPRQRRAPNEPPAEDLLQDVERSLVRERRQLTEGELASSQAFAVARSDELPGRLWVPQVLVNPGGKAVRTIGYGNGAATQFASIAIVDEDRARTLESSLDQSQLAILGGFGGGFGFGDSFGGVVQQDQQACLLPRAATVDPVTKSLLVTCLGIDSLVAFDAASTRPSLTEKRRWRVPSGPTGVAVDAARKRAIVWSQFDRAVSIVPLSGPELVNEQQDLDDKVSVIKVPSSGTPVDGAVAMGRRIFHASGDSRISFDGRACASCHPDGRDDALTWSTPNGPRRTLTLADRLPHTEPYAWDGTSRDLHHHLATTFRRLRGSGVTDVERDALVAYLRSLASPRPIAARAPSDVIEVGESIFRSKETGCASCHEGSLSTDNRKHNVESRGEADAEAKFNTPSLRHVAQRAPYFHDGRYATLRELLVGSDGMMGHSKHLEPRQVSALLAYLESL